MKHLKKIALIFAVVVCFAVGFFAVEVSAGTTGTYGDLTYTVSNGEVTITRCNTSASGKLEIPAKIGAYPVTCVGGDYIYCEDCEGDEYCGAFQSCWKLTNIIIPDGVTSIGNAAFYGCSSLTNITIPDSVTSIGGGVFYGCSSLKDVKLPNNITSLSAYFGEMDDGGFFESCRSLTNITIPDSVTSIGYSAFSGCKSLTSITIPDSVTSIDYEAFRDCTGLTSVTIGNGVTSIGSYAFSGCTGLINITIPDSVTRIDSYAFSGCSGLTSITISDSVISIGSSAFYGCSGLTSITIPDSVTSIGSSAFYGCSGLTSTTIPDSVTTIGSYSFCDCAGLTEFIIGSGIAEITGNEGLSTCTKLQKITFTGFNTEIYDSSSTIPDSVIIACKHNSKALSYALTYNRTVELLDEHILKVQFSVPATCTAYGYDYGECQCGYVGTTLKNPTGHYDADNDNFCDYCCLAMTSTSYNHNYKLSIKNATCTEEGAVTMTCTKCGAKTVETIEKLGHNYVDFTFEPTCTQSGYTRHVCVNCGDSYTDSKVPATGHINTTEVIAPTCSTNGYTIYKCSICDNTYTSKIVPATGHTPTTLKAVTATVKKSGLTAGSKCSVCGEVLTKQTMTLAQATGLKASTTTATSITLKWTAINGAKYYKIEQYNASTKKWTAIKTTTATSYTVSKLTAGTTYKFRVTALDSTKKIAGKASATLAATTLCAAPTIKLTSTKSKTATVTITKVTGAKSYTVYKSTDGKKWTSVITTTKTTYNLTGLNAGKKIYVKVIATNADGKVSADSAVASVTVKK